MTHVITHLFNKDGVSCFDPQEAEAQSLGFFIDGLDDIYAIHFYVSVGKEEVAAILRRLANDIESAK
jgi:hypothetical protein